MPSRRGVELIPCVQTLAHFTTLAKLGRYSEIVDFNDFCSSTRKTYELIEKIEDFYPRLQANNYQYVSTVNIL